MTPTAAITTKVDAGLRIRGNALEMQLVIVNLVKNALQATDQLAAGQVVVKVATENGNILFSVADNGSTLSEQAFSRLLEPLQTQKLRLFQP